MAQVFSTRFTLILRVAAGLVVGAVGVQLDHQVAWRLGVAREAQQTAAAVALGGAAAPAQLGKDVHEPRQGTAAARRLARGRRALARVVR